MQTLYSKAMQWVSCDIAPVNGACRSYYGVKVFKVPK